MIRIIKNYMGSKKVRKPGLGKKNLVKAAGYPGSS
jgi:hypothetical protein